MVATAQPVLYAYTMLNVLQTDCNLCMMTVYFLLFNNSKCFWVSEVGGRGECVDGVIWIWWEGWGGSDGEEWWYKISWDIVGKRFVTNAL